MNERSFIDWNDKLIKKFIADQITLFNNKFLFGIKIFLGDSYKI